MASSLFPDPMQLWRDAVSKLESEVNSLATGSTNSQKVVRSLHQFSSATLGVQQMVEKAITAYLRSANLPSSKEVAELAESLQRIEDKLDRLLPADTTDEASRPARTRRPAVSVAAPVPVPEPAAVAKPAAKPAAKRRAAPPAQRATTRRTKG